MNMFQGRKWLSKSGGGASSNMASILPKGGGGNCPPYSYAPEIDYFMLSLFLVPKLKSVAENELKKHPYIFFFLLLVQK